MRSQIQKIVADYMLCYIGRLSVWQGCTIHCRSHLHNSKQSESAARQWGIGMRNVVYLLAWVGSSSQQCICFWLVADGKHFMQGCCHADVFNFQIHGLAWVTQAQKHLAWHTRHAGFAACLRAWLEHAWHHPDGPSNTIQHETRSYATASLGRCVSWKNLSTS